MFSQSVSRRWPLAEQAKIFGVNMTLVLCKLLICGVATYDTYLTLKYAEYLDVYEQNPIGRWLLQLDSGPINELQQTAAFVAAKFAGTTLVLLVLQGLCAWRNRTALMVAVPVALFQLGLAYYLLWWTFS